MDASGLLFVLVASIGTVSTAWAAWVSKMLISMYALLQRTDERVEGLETMADDHETRIRVLETHPMTP